MSYSNVMQIFNVYYGKVRSSIAVDNKGQSDTPVSKVLHLVWGNKDI